MLAGTAFVLFAFLFKRVQMSQGCDSCPDGWVPFERSCYLFADTQSIPFTKAEHYCREQGGHLVEIDSSAENKFLKKYLWGLRRMNFWMGLTDGMKEGAWIWSDSRSPITYTDWASGEPDDAGGEDCAFFHTGEAACRLNWVNCRWHDITCAMQLIPLCERRKTTSAQIVG